MRFTKRFDQISLIYCYFHIKGAKPLLEKLIPCDIAPLERKGEDF